ncbi:MAG: tagaturonate epimerase family protein [Candidatus Promineifilaceae bacterium]|nr:tagaturonate epimerase family protein [Candidatus Promineifilaceae bacterium]
MTLVSFPQGSIYRDSIVTDDENVYALGRLEESGEQRLLVRGNTEGFHGQRKDDLLVGKLTTQNAAELRMRLKWLSPVPLGRQTSFGFGDRLGSATPGHISALRAVDKNQHIMPIFAQQSVRENSRTGRTPQEVLDDAMWGIFQKGWRTPWGADADHIKEVPDLAPFIEAGYTFYTIDPSDYVDNEAQTDSLEALRQKSEQLPWERFGRSYQVMKEQYCEQPILLEDLNLAFDEETFLRALIKYGRGILHTAEIASVLDQKMRDVGYDLEMSVDETDTPTSVYEHYFIANELITRGIPVVSLAPRFVGKFQKGVDYMGSIAEFKAELVKHMAVLHHFDSYKVSVHTGSDKFAIYGIINEQAQGHVHVKTAGTSYLEALRVVAVEDPQLFRKMLDLAHKNFKKDRKTYFVDCRPERVPQAEQLNDAQLPDLLEQFDARQLLHVTFGSILDAYGEELEAFIAHHETQYQAGLEKHFGRHLRPFC